MMEYFISKHFVMHRGYFLLLCTVLLTGLIFFSCSKNSPTGPSLSISSVVSSTPQVGDTIIINGSDFGSQSDGGTILFSSGITVPSSACVLWSATQIKTTVPLTAVAGDVVVRVNGATSNEYYLNVQWPRFLLQSGLADSIVYCLAIDGQNIKWFGTDKGLSRFDGTIWTTYTTKNGLPSNNIYCISPDNAGNIWIGTDAGAAKFNGSNWTIYSSPNVLPNNIVNAIAFDDTGNVWIGTEGGIVRSNGAGWKTYQYNDSIKWRYGQADTATCNPSNNILCIAIDKRGHEWFGSNNEGIFERINDTIWVQNLGTYWVRSLAIDSQNVKWCGTLAGGVWQYNDTTFTQYDKPNSGSGLADYTVTSIAFDSHDVKWFGTYNGVSKFDGVNWTTYNTNNGLLNNFIYGLAFDKQGNLWVATNGGGVAMFNPNQ